MSGKIIYLKSPSSKVKAMYKVIYFFNWICIGLLAVFVLLMLFEPRRGGGDAYGRGLAEGFLYLGSAALVILLLLNLLPWQWSKYLAFALILLPFLFYSLSSQWSNYSKALKARVEAAKPIFTDPSLERLARLIQNGEPEALQKRLPSEPQAAVQSEELLWFAINEASGSSFRNKEKVECLSILLDAGAPLAPLMKEETPVHSYASNTGNAGVLRLLFERGLDPNTRDPHFDRPYIFDAVASYIDPVGSVRVFLEYGADPNATAVFDDEDGPITPLIRAAQFDKWDVCAALIEKGAKPDFITPNGKNCAFYMDQAAEAVEQYGRPETRASFARLRALVNGGK